MQLTMNILSILRRLKRWYKSDFVPFVKMCLYNSVCKSYIELFGTHDKRNMRHRISLCLIFKNEALFLKEWLDYHLTIGVDHFYLYNNNSTDNYLVVLKPYVEKGLVTLTEWPRPNSQFQCYKHCFDTFRRETNWISFLDADEFICLKHEIDINEWIKRFDKYHAINIHWLMFCTGGMLNHDYSKNVIEQYYACWSDFWKHGKCMINTRYEIGNYDTYWVHHHTYMFRRILGIKTLLPAVNQFGYICTIDKTWGGGNNKRLNSNIQINHYFTKSWDIWSSKKKKTDVLFKNNPKSDINYFYKYEDKCVSRDYTIQRFFIRMKIKQGFIKW